MHKKCFYQNETFPGMDKFAFSIKNNSVMTKIKLEVGRAEDDQSFKGKHSDCICILHTWTKRFL